MVARGSAGNGHLSLQQDIEPIPRIVFREKAFAGPHFPHRAGSGEPGRLLVVHPLKQRDLLDRLCHTRGNDAGGKSAHDDVGNGLHRFGQRERPQILQLVQPHHLHDVEPLHLIEDHSRHIGDRQKIQLQ
jgi:hypothetical protein